MTNSENQQYFARFGIQTSKRSNKNEQKALSDSQKRSLRSIRTDEGLCKFATKNAVMVAV